ncbi:MAG TPA: zf-HC2 domain-containing protein [Thermoanaerobaculia bacterium]|nr:zf-HC2 domain-containing protein [Thermoanaerobaculia bacterium]
MLCNDVKRVVYFFLDGQLGEKKQQDVNGHLSLCPECEQRANVARKLRTFVQKRIARVGAPDHLKTRLQRSIRAFRNEWANDGSLSNEAFR